ncbi:MspA family porin [Williamsia deligens]|uniref:MspA family porin n=1 Tax=Williamsia deligens TaxID=321325 RepID=A0ABW3G992_9NOCA|nr:MspA family porin [Williamsia deligens]MCP2192561.1 MspA protein [Williamsia deligens]
MSTKSKLGLRRLAAAAAVVAVSAVGLASMGAGNAAAGALPNGSKTTVGVDGTTIKLARTGEGIFPVKSQANNGAGRAAETFGNFFATYPKGTSGKLTVGYLIGCQINIEGLKGGLGFSVGGPSASNALPLPSFGLSGSLTVPLSPGQVQTVAVGAKELKGTTAAVQLQRFQIDVQQCGGYAQARSIAVLETTGDYYIKSTLYGVPFTLG